MVAEKVEAAFDPADDHLEKVTPQREEGTPSARQGK